MNMRTESASAPNPDLYASIRPARSKRSQLLSLASRSYVGTFCALILLTIIAIAIAAPVVATYPPNEIHRFDRLAEPGASPSRSTDDGGIYLLGTDQLGRDVFSRIVYGARVSLEVGAISTATAILIATVIGLTAAYWGGIWDYLTGRVIELFQALPGLVLLLALLTVFGRSLASVSLVLGVTTGVLGARVVRSAALTVAAQPFVEVARSVGCSTPRILTVYLLVNLIPILSVVATINVGFAIISEASLAFLGYGVPPPAPSWGSMLSSEGRIYMVQAPWLFIAPTVALASIVFSVNMLGDVLRDQLDPRLRGSI